MVYLGINVSHGASAALMINGKIEAVFQEERITKIKNFNGYPKRSIDCCVAYAAERKLKIDIAAFSTRVSDHFGLKYPISHFFTVGDYKDFYGKEYYSRIIQKKSVKNYLKKLNNDKRNSANLYLNYKKINNSNYNNIKIFNNLQKNMLVKQSRGLIKKILFLDHHTCHAYYALYSIDRKLIKKNKFAVLTLDSIGDGSNQTFWIFDNKKNKLININRSSKSELARVYKMVTLILSMKPDEHEYKVMGLAPYSKAKFAQDIYKKVFKNILTVKNCKIIHNKRPRDLYLYLEKNLKEFRFDNIAGAAQLFVEKVSSKLLGQIFSKYKIKHFAITGGVSLNIKMNKLLSELKFVKSIHVAPTGSDDSLSMGACYFLAKEKSKALENIYLGQNLFKNQKKTSSYIKKYFGNKKFVVRKNISTKKIGELLKKGEIIALAHGKEEFGARALGNRSIIANPSDYGVVKKINEMIKSRDFWMPFALTILEEKHKAFLDNSKNLSCEYMTMGFDVKKSKVKKIIAGCHPYDKTVRPQILKKIRNESYYNLIKSFYKLTGIPAVLNTSLNLHGNPIASDIHDVYKVFLNSELKYLYINNNYLIKKNIK